MSTAGIRADAGAQATSWTPPTPPPPPPGTGPASATVLADAFPGVWEAATSLVRESDSNGDDRIDLARAIQTTPRAEDGSLTTALGLFLQADKEGDRDGFTTIPEVGAMLGRYDAAGNGNGRVDLREGARLLRFVSRVW